MFRLFRRSGHPTCHALHAQQFLSGRIMSVILRSRGLHRVWGGLAVIGAACARAAGPPVAPGDIPHLEAAVAANPEDGLSMLRLAAAHLAAGDCERALPAARRGIELRPQDALGPLAAGDCLERRGNSEEAVALYDDYIARYGSNVGAEAVAARALLARRALATSEARHLLAREAQLSPEPADRNVLAVMPLEVIGDSAYGPLSVGIANLLTSDLVLLQRFRLVERMRLDALLDEIQLGQTAVVDPATAVRAGRLLRAGSVVHGVTLVPPDEGVRIDVSVLDPGSQVVGTESVSGKLKDLLRLEKNLVIGIAGRLGHQLSAAERRAILENGTQSLAAFLAFSRGLLDQEAGNYPAAAAQFARAVRADPAFRQARESHRATVAAANVQQAGAGAVTTLATAKSPDAAQPTGAESAAGAVRGGVQEVAPTMGEVLGGGSVGQQAASTSTATPPPSTTGSVAQMAIFGFRFILRFP
jgi:tetratricopeptide (TPR) repeat protein